MEQRGFFPKKCFENWWNTAGGSTRWRSAGWSRLLKQDAGKVWNGRLPREWFSVKQKTDFQLFGNAFPKYIGEQFLWEEIQVLHPPLYLRGVQCWGLFFSPRDLFSSLKTIRTHGTFLAVPPGPATHRKQKAPSVWNDTKKTKMGRHEFPFWTAKPANSLSPSTCWTCMLCDYDLLSGLSTGWQVVLCLEPHSRFGDIWPFARLDGTGVGLDWDGFGALID